MHVNVTLRMLYQDWILLRLDLEGGGQNFPYSTFDPSVVIRRTRMGNGTQDIDGKKASPGLVQLKAG